MCGFLGAIDFENEIRHLHPFLQIGLKAVSHRGPDGSMDFKTGNVYLGHNRLSIIDLSSDADQPFKSVNASAYILFNGEIYNYKELKKELSGKRLKTDSDTEILLEGYLSEGVRFFEKLRGIYAFAVFDDRSERKMILGRDPSGIKPLYFYEKNGLYIFGSEIKAILPAVGDDLNVNESVLKSYLNLGFCLEPFTIYREINCIEPGSIVEINAGGIRRHNSIKFSFTEKNDFSFEENVRRVEEKLEKAVERNLTADVEVAVALSGGIDSSLIYAYANRLNGGIRGLTVRSADEEYDETAAARKYSSVLRGRYETVEADTELNLETLNRIFLNFDQPYADSSAVNVYYLTRAASRLTKVLLGGDGGDELFNGYPSQTWLALVNRCSSGAAFGKGGKALFSLGIFAARAERKRSLRRFSDLWTDAPAELLYDWHSWFPRKTKFQNQSPFKFDTSEGLEFYNSVFRNEVPADFRSQIVFDYFRKQMLSDYLRKTDMTAMLNGVEYRVPMLDEDLTAFALSIPFEQKSSLRETKKILRALHRKIYPPALSGAPKKGFSIPLDASLSREEFFCIREELLKNDCIVHRYIKKDYINFLFNALEDGESVRAEISRAAVYQRILMLYSLSLWSENRKNSMRRKLEKAVV